MKLTATALFPFVLALVQATPWEEQELRRLSRFYKAPKAAKAPTPKQPDFVIIEKTTDDSAFVGAVAGGYALWVNLLFPYDTKTETMGSQTGTSNGRCMFLTEDGPDGPSICDFSFMLTNQAGEVSTLSISGGLPELDWSTPRSLAVVGGTGEFFGASGSMQVVEVNESTYMNKIYLA